MLNGFSHTSNGQAQRITKVYFKDSEKMTDEAVHRHIDM